MRIIAIPFRGLLKRSIIPLSCYLESAYLSGNNPATVQPQSIDLFGPPIQKSPYSKRRDPMKKFSRITSVCALLLIGIAAPSPTAAAPPDPVLQWINIMNDTVLAGGTPPFFTSRIAAMVSASVFDAVNGIDPRYRPIHVPPNAPDGASPRAAAIICGARGPSALADGGIALSPLLNLDA
jgi:hypothetical protein